MRSLLVPAAILAMVCTVLATLTAVVFCLGMGANATPAQIHALKLWMGGLSLLGVTGVGAGILLLRTGDPGWSAAVSIAPTVIMGLILIVALRR